MECPICAGEALPYDCSVVDKAGKKVAVQGRVYAIIDAEGIKHANYSPYSEYLTVSLYPRKGKVKYLKFETQEELEKWGFGHNVRYVVHGCMHIVDGKELVFGITKVQSVTQ